MNLHPKYSLTLLLILQFHSSDARAQSTGNSDVQTVTVRNRTEVIQAVQAAKPGTQVLIAPGTYRGSLDFRGLRGSEQRPIVIAGLDPNDPPVLDGGGSGMHLTGASHVELRDLIFINAEGNGLNIDDGGKADLNSEHLVLRRLTVRDVGPKGNRDGIKLSGVDHFVVDGCRIERWGDNGSAIDMVGCHQGRIHNCVFVYRSELAANGVQTKGASSEIVIERCRFEHAGNRAVNIGGSTGLEFFRPLGAPYEARSITVQDCTFIGSMSPIAFVGVDGATVQHNTIYQPERWVIRILQESQGEPFVPCRNGVFRNNLIVFRSNMLSSTVNVGGGTAAETFTFDSNHWYCADMPERSQPRDLPAQETNGVHGIAPKFVNEATLDLRFALDAPPPKAGVRELEEPKP
jgi:hypothetical protein